MNCDSFKESLLTMATVMIVALVAACESQGLKTPDDVKRDLTEQMKNAECLSDIAHHPQRSSAEALRIAKDFYSHNMLRSQTNDDDFEVDYILSDNSLRSASENDGITPVDTVVYIINVKDNGGFAIVSGDKRVTDLYAITESGNLHSDDVIEDNSGFAVFLSRMPIYYELSLREFEKKNELMRYSPGHVKPEDDIDRSDLEKRIYGDWKSEVKVQSMISVNWGQGHPYNDYAPFIDGQHASAGCVAVAAAQFTAYYKFPNEFDGIHLDWNLLTKYPSAYNYTYDSEERNTYSTQVAYYLRAIGNALGNTWGIYPAGTGAFTADIVNLLKSMGYRNPSTLTSFNENGIKSSLSKSIPVIMDGCCEKKVYEKGWWIFKKTEVVYERGHAWLVDGYASRHRSVRVVRELNGEFIREDMEYETLFHCNWGWLGSKNGYFVSRIFDSNHSIDLRSYDAEWNTPGCYQFDIHNILNAYK